MTSLPLLALAIFSLWRKPVGHETRETGPCVPCRLAPFETGRSGSCSLIVWKAAPKLVHACCSETGSFFQVNRGMLRNKMNASASKGPACQNADGQHCGCYWWVSIPPSVPSTAQTVPGATARLLWVA